MSAPSVIQPSESTTTYTELRAAADELLDYVSYASLSELNAEKSKVADTSRRSESSKICELLLGMSAEVPLYTEASTIINSVGGVNPIQTAVIAPESLLRGNGGSTGLALVTVAVMVVRLTD